jgi:1,4-alpha-glucan branching enzyme
MSKDPVHRKHHHSQITFRSVYAFSENFMLPLSHDEVVHGKGSLLTKMPGDEWQKFANLRLLLGYQFAQPGKKLMFMGCEFGQRKEWNHDNVLDWSLLELKPHDGIRRWVQDLNRFYQSEPGLAQLDCSPSGFRWVDGSDGERSVLSFLRCGTEPGSEILIVFNFTPVPRQNYRVGVPQGGFWQELLNSDAPLYGGSGVGNIGGQNAAPIPSHGSMWSLNLTLPPLGALFMKRSGEAIETTPNPKSK